MNVDLTGVSGIPQNFIEVKKGTVLNLKLDSGLNLSLPLYDWRYSVPFCAQIRAALAEIERAFEYEDGLLADQVIANNIAIISHIIFEIAKPLIKKKNHKRIRQDIYSTFSDIEKLDDACEHILNYFELIKKKIRVKAKGSSLRQTYGQDYSDALLVRVTQQAKRKKRRSKNS